MITIKNFMETVNYRITEGSEYGWSCYGDNAYRLSSWNGDNDNGHSVEIIFDTGTQVVYEMSACDYSNSRAYRWILPNYRKNHSTIAEQYTANPNQAWDDVNYIDLETEEDILEKASAIVLGQEYDTRISVPIEFPEKDLFQLMKLAHENDITLNDYVERILRNELGLDNQNDVTR